jgi:hypothetical protein
MDHDNHPIFYRFFRARGGDFARIPATDNEQADTGVVFGVTCSPIPDTH